ncbi:hypothetical protein [Aulosira sp. FACHB-615]|uniref:hypothetical protein n=1 Tax=Aulosira sp. FACHB-615 TaxID=2692777 RepID=UPI00168725C6|nr:hypothetical protein [Aulosira sp. FACHB-615]MBD2492430.1 hypothetical protein [Aulosira sp. FACHB-615]
MLPTLSEFGIEPPVYIRKIDSRASWHPQEGDANLAERARLAATKLFKEPDNIYSLWLVNTEQEFYSVVASLSANRSPKNQNLDFIAIKETELREVGINFQPVSEGGCLYVQSLHFNAQIDKETAEKLCYSLMSQGREAQRCKKVQTTEILEHQQKFGCRATDSPATSCECNQWTLTANLSQT